MAIIELKSGAKAELEELSEFDKSTITHVFRNEDDQATITGKKCGVTFQYTTEEDSTGDRQPKGGTADVLIFYSFASGVVNNGLLIKYDRRVEIIKDSIALNSDIYEVVPYMLNEIRDYVKKHNLTDINGNLLEIADLEYSDFAS
jgi:hypothetical protein